MPEVSGRTVEDSNKLSMRWGYDKWASPRYTEDFMGDGVVVDDLFTEKVDEKTVDITKLRKGVNARVTARNFRGGPELERELEERDYPSYEPNNDYI